eukprot:10592462-Alexandrium_andersonii.AAC.1
MRQRRHLHVQVRGQVPAEDEVPLHDPGDNHSNHVKLGAPTLLELLGPRQVPRQPGLSLCAARNVKTRSCLGRYTFNCVVGWLQELTQHLHDMTR